MSTPAHPLTDADLADIKQRLADLAYVDAEIDRAARAGIDTGDQKRQAKELRDQLMKLKSAYFPGR
jgi:hypothetical protein